MFRSIAKLFYSAFNRPYMSVNLKFQKNGRLNVDAVYNERVVDEIDRLYAEMKRTDYNPTMADHDKVALFVAEMVADLNPLGGQPPAAVDEEGNEIDPVAAPLNPDVPILGSVPVKQTIDLADRTGKSRFIG